mgnify:CR=1 FL=1
MKCLERQDEWVEAIVHSSVGTRASDVNIPFLENACGSPHCTLSWSVSLSLSELWTSESQANV